MNKKVITHILDNDEWSGCIILTSDPERYEREVIALNGDEWRGLAAAFISIEDCLGDPGCYLAEKINEALANNEIVVMLGCQFYPDSGDGECGFNQERPWRIITETKYGYRTVVGIEPV